MSIPGRPRHRVVRAVLGLLKACGVLLTFLVGVVAGVLLHLDAPPARRFVVRELNAILAPQFKGTITVERLGHLSIFGVGGVDATVRAADGEPVIVGRGVAARIRPIALVRGALSAHDLMIHVDDISVDAIEVNLDSAPDGSLKLAGAFDPKTPSPPSPPGARGTVIELPTAAVRHAWVHGLVQGVPPLDADVDDIRAGFLSSPAVTKVDVGHLHLLARGLPLGATPAGVVVAHLALPSAPDGKMVASASFEGGVGAIPLTANVAMSGDAVDGVLDVPKVSAAEVRASVATAPVYGDVSAHGEVHGDLSNLRVALHAGLARGSLDVDGTLDVKGPLAGHATIVAKDIDARTFAESAPATELGARVEASAKTTADKALALHASIDIPIGVAAGQRVPHTTLAVDALQKSGQRGSMISGHLQGLVDEPGAPLALVADGRVDAGISTVTFGATADIPRLDKVARLGSVGSGKATLTVEGEATVAKTIELSGRVAASVDGFKRPEANVQHLALVGRIDGSTSHPKLEVHILGSGVSASRYAFSRLEVDAAGGLEQAQVALRATGSSAPDVDLHADVGLKGALRLNDVRLRLRRGDKSLRVQVASARMAGETFEVSGLDVGGDAGPLGASLRASPGALHVKATSTGLDLGTLAYLTAQDDKKITGKVSLDVDMDARRDHALGDIMVELTNGGWGDARGANAHVRLDLDGRHLTGDLHSTLADAGTVDFHDMDVHIGGQGPLHTEAWREAWGKASFLADVDLGRVLALVPPGSIPVSDLSGHLKAEGDLERDSLADLTPEVRLSLVTEGLTASLDTMKPVRRPGGPLMVGPAAWSLKGVDFGADVIIDGVDSAGEFSLRVTGEHGAIGAVDVETAPLPFATILGEKKGEGLVAALEELPIRVLVDFPRQHLEQLPLILRPDGISGAAEGAIALKGTVRHPNVNVSMKAHDLLFSTAPTTPVEGGVQVTYDGHAAHADVDLQSEKARLLKVSADATANVNDFLDAAVARPDWTASMKADLSHFPLGAISLLQADQVRGFVSGNLSLTGLHEHAAADVTLALEDVKVGQAPIMKGDVRVTLDDGGLHAHARLDAPAGSLQANAKMGLKWGAEVAPRPDGSGFEATLQAKHFAAAAALPFAAGAISELSGWLDADAKVSLAPGQKPTMSGAVAFSDGVILAPALGEEFRGVKAKVTLSSDGTIKLSDTEARGLSGKLTLSGDARLDGTTLRTANVTMAIRKGEAIPLDIQGTNLGTVYGNVTVQATGASDNKQLAIVVNVPSFHVDLPDASLPRSPQGLGDAPGVHVGVYRSPDRFLLLPVDNASPKVVAARTLKAQPLTSQDGSSKANPTPPPPGETDPPKSAGPALDVAIKIGDVQIVRGQQLALDVDGNLTAKVAAATKVRGEIHVKSGKLNVQSKEFTIDKGTVSFVGDDPSNPEVNVTAGWNAPDGTRVLADYIGPVRTGKVNLRSEPPRPKNEIVSLILFGTADGSSATPYASRSPSTGTEAGTAVGGLATDGLSKGLDQLTGMNVTTKIDTSDSANPRPEVEVQIAKEISLKLAVVLGTPPPGTNPDTTYATIDWRFVRNWSLETTFGDYGSTFADVVWQHRY